MEIWKGIEERLKQTSLVYFAFFTEYPGHARVIAAKIANGASGQERVIAVGGDGTLHEVMNGIQKRDIPLGFIPGGSGNDFSRGLEIPADPIDALNEIIRLAETEFPLIDIGKVTFEDQSERYFINNMGAGFDAVISFEVNRSRLKAVLNKLSLGRLIYVFFLIKMLFVYKPSTVEMQIDGKKYCFDQTWFATVSNQPFYGGGMKIAPNALPDDGLLDIIVAHRLSKWKLLLVFITVFLGKHTRFKEVEVLRGRTVAIQSSVPLYVHADGEHVGITPLVVNVQPGAQAIISRRKSGQPSEKLAGREMSEQS